MDPQVIRVPAHNECRNDRLIPSDRTPKEIDDRDLLLHRVPEPAVIGRVRVGAHEGVFDDIIAHVDLAMGLALIVIPDPTASPGEYGSDGQQPCHLPGLEDAALRVNERDAVAAGATQLKYIPIPCFTRLAPKALRRLGVVGNILHMPPLSLGRLERLERFQHSAVPHCR